MDSQLHIQNYKRLVDSRTILKINILFIKYMYICIYIYYKEMYIMEVFSKNVA